MLGQSSDYGWDVLTFKLLGQKNVVIHKHGNGAAVQLELLQCQTIKILSNTLSSYLNPF